MPGMAAAGPYDHLPHPDDGIPHLTDFRKIQPTRLTLKYFLNAENTGTFSFKF